MRSSLLPAALLALAFSVAAPLAGCSATADPTPSASYGAYNTYGDARAVSYEQPYYDHRPVRVDNDRFDRDHRDASDRRDYDHRDHAERHYDRYDQHEFGAAQEELRNAYATLAVANHNYHWHRVDAMNHIRHALQLMGTDIAGNGQGHERQAVSNDQLRHTEATLNHLRERLHDHHPQIANEIEQAAVAIHRGLEARH